MKLNVKVDASAVTKMLDGLKKEFSSRRTGVIAGYLDGDVEKGGTRIADIALWNEHGTVRAPARPFLTKAQKGLEARGRKIMKAGLDDELDFDDIVINLAWAAQDEIIKAIRSNIPPENAESTIRRKHSSHTLIDTGVLMSSAKPGIIKDGVATVLTGK